MDANSPADYFVTPAAIPKAHRPGPVLEQRHYLCNGELRCWDGPVHDVFSPVYLASAAGSPAPLRLGSHPLLGSREAEAMLEAACNAYDRGCGEWPSMSPSQRLARVEQLLAGLEKCRQEVVRSLMWEIGKSREESEMEFSRTLEYLAETAVEIRRRSREEEGLLRQQGVIARRLRAPVGVALCLGPYNNPFYETYTTLIPLLLMGNTVIFKPPRLGVLLHRFILPLLQECFPPGVVNSLYGEGEAVLAPVLRSGRIDLLAFIGSRRGAELLRSWHPTPGRLRCLLGMEAKNAAIILADADLEQAAAECALGALAFNGQRCTALKILLVQHSITLPFLEQLSREVQRQPIGMPWLPGVRITPLPEPARVAYLGELLADALSKGARIINPGGGEIRETLMTPAVLYPVGPGMRLYHEEQFGPLIPVASFETLEEARRYVAESEFGQQVSVFGQDEEQLAAVSRSLLNQVCRININSKCQRGPDGFPFTARRNSAEGTMSVAETLDACSITSLVAGRDTPGNQRILAASTYANSCAKSYD
ncbi:aldehyde dehydrogenase family protein [Desulfurivibrio alkaliphilus]|uniref:Aldehyde Dehydrogenase n=1 Tax=Desulfurivibrio alkaliphilus (strain DSM 19089 / UNIQEM U267 / AHT2) TaxID=589865 RepID=D6Z0N0_DESAT|nr:aldehyde dehydrogenase family protein [Desulfurivibrio alkaliphilus]ADH85259.1 Aldehyde Dehydrogenase [Desulfurivibrio alkaliphilus AHT 2]